jgi:hypothetical protein
MISSIKAAIVAKLKELYPLIRRYTDDDIPQNFAKPSFYLSVFDQEYGNLLKNRHKGVISFDLAYHSDKELATIKSDCLLKQEELLRGLNLIGIFRASNKNARITDNVLHITFDVHYREKVIDNSEQMQSQTTNTNI